MAEILTSSIAVKLAQKPLNDIYEFIKQKTGEKIDELKNQKTIDSLNSKIQQIVMVKTIRKIDEPVDLNTFFYPPKMINSSHNQNIDIRVLSDLSTTRKILIQGTVGQGKSILMRYLASKELESSGRIPLFFELRKLEENQTINALIKSLLADWLFVTTEKAVNTLLMSGKVVLFLDGYDELTALQANKMIKEIDQLYTKFGNKLQIVVSSRFNSKIEYMNIFHNYEISPLGLIEQKGIINLLINEEELRGKLISAIRSAKADVKGLLTTPLLITLFIMTYSSHQIIPESISEFYEQIFQLLLVRHDNTKITLTRERESKLNNDQLKIIFETISCISISENKFSFKEREFISLIEKAISYNKLEEDPNKVVNDITKSLCLILQDGTDYTFIHKSIAEFFCAKFIRNHSKPEIFYKKFKEDYGRFKIVALFLEQIDQYRFYKIFLKDTLQNIEKMYIDVNDRNYILNNILIKEIVDQEIFAVIILVPDDASILEYYMREYNVLNNRVFGLVAGFSTFSLRFILRSSYEQLCNHNEDRSDFFDSDEDVISFVPLSVKSAEYAEFSQSILGSKSIFTEKLRAIDLYITKTEDVSIFDQF